VRPHRVVLQAESIEGVLLRGAGAPDRADGLALQRAVHALVRPVLLRPARMDALMLNAEPQPPHVEEGYRAPDFLGQ
jgi:hypothetical protein